MSGGKHMTADQLLQDAVKLHLSGDLDGAARQYKNLLKLSPLHPDGLHLSGLVAMQKGQLTEAERLIRGAIAATPKAPAFHGNLGTVLLGQGRTADAMACYRRAVELDDSFVDGWRNIASLAARLDDHEGSALAYSNVVRLTGGADGGALGYLGLELAVLCDWDNLPVVKEAISALPSWRTGKSLPVPPFTLLVHDFSPAELRRHADEAATFIESRVAPMVHQPKARRPRLRLGYLSEDFHDHATAYLLAEALESHDRSRFEIFAYSYGPEDKGAVRTRLRDACDHWVELAALSEADCAKRIAADGIDILVDLKGHTGRARTSILAARPAPIQVAWLGFPGTFGGTCMDYIIADPYVIPAGAENDYAEQVVRLPLCYQPNDSRRARAATREPKAKWGLPEDAFVIAVFNNSFKFNAETLAVWVAVLQAQPDAVLWFVEFHPAATASLRAMMGAVGIDASRLIFAPRLPQAEHMLRLSAADLFLDTWPCAGHTTASDALWAGVPLVAWAGRTFASRVAGSLLHALGLDELIAESQGGYHALAQHLAKDREALEQVRQRLWAATQASPLFDGKAFTPPLERALDTMWAKWEKGEKPKGFDV
ncbi:O-linked N-acetylglucosamine transferase, SPINDLY family protein [Paramagnetospirillum magnetotacticum]|uniref:O-linked N-acetylglucosamine transferase, SPINDLY family protein n=1 Tax=Paramagnetospirillum magnetotacticum TaxID=188 RepID=UPI001F3CFD4E|nr:tetratricopeptide repeat protein [Paramagnetospirillum magnetotacticum]